MSEDHKHVSQCKEFEKEKGNNTFWEVKYEKLKNDANYATKDDKVPHHVVEEDLTIFARTKPE